MNFARACVCASVCVCVCGGGGGGGGECSCLVRQDCFFSSMFLSPPYKASNLKLGAVGGGGGGGGRKVRMRIWVCGVRAPAQR